MLDKLLPADPRPSLEVVVGKCLDQRLCLVQPRGMYRRSTGPPPTPTSIPVRRRGGCCVAWVSVLHQEHALQRPMPAAYRPQFSDVVFRILAGFHRQFHLAAVYHQEEQQVDRAVPGVLELLLLDMSGDGPPDRATLQHLVVGL